MTYKRAILYVRSARLILIFMIGNSTLNVSLQSNEIIYDLIYSNHIPYSNFFLVNDSTLHFSIFKISLFRQHHSYILSTSCWSLSPLCNLYYKKYWKRQSIIGYSLVCLVTHSLTNRNSRGNSKGPRLDPCGTPCLT